MARKRPTPEQVDQAKRLKELDSENLKLKHLVGI